MGQQICVFSLVYNSHESLFLNYRASLEAQTAKNPPAMGETWVQSLGWEDTLEEGMATHSSILAWRIPWTEEPGKIQSMKWQRVGHDRVTKCSTDITWLP